jgi:hypothetical protein
LFDPEERSMDSVGALDYADMGKAASNGNGESPATNTTTTLVLLSLLQLTRLLVK